MSSAVKCPCVARVSLSRGDIWCDIYMRFSFMALADHNELDRYRHAVVDNEIERCNLPRRDGVVDCITYCEDGIRGVEFKSYAEKKPVKELIREIGNKYLQDAKCNDQCVLILVVSGDRLPYISAILGSNIYKFKIITETDITNINKLQENICKYRVVVVGINRTGVRGCRGRRRRLWYQ
jgi:hypothetical protein